MNAKNEYRIEGNVVWIKLTQGKETCVDLADWPKGAGHRWFAVKRGKTGFYAVAKMRNGQKRIILRLHRLILDSAAPAIDHKEGDGLDNRRAKLRPCSDAENTQNRGKNRNNTSGFKGVTLHKATNLWCARIGFNGVRRTVGYYHCPIEAAVAYNEAAKELHGEFAYQNSI